MLYAEPQLNGNEKRDFGTAAMAMQIARDRLADAMKTMHSHVLHGRNYQHTDPRNRAVDLDSMIPLTLALTRMDALVEDLSRKANRT
jgi:hypothetical protein